MTADLAFHELHGEEILPWLDGLGELRITVFREYPYLYEGTLEYERDYLKTYAASSRSMILLVANAAGKVVGATTCLPLLDEGPEFQEPFVRHNYDLSQICYFGESILLPELRGRGIGKLFFRQREAHAAKLGLPITVFCAVNRATYEPLKPSGYRPLDDFWVAQGYTKHPELEANFVWKEIGEPAESPKTLTFWMKHAHADG